MIHNARTRLFVRHLILSDDIAEAIYGRFGDLRCLLRVEDGFSSSFDTNTHKFEKDSFGVGRDGI